MKLPISGLESLNMMSSLSRLQRGLKSPNLLFRELNRLYYRRLNLRTYNSAGVDILAEDWDNLLILDACRYDMFKSYAELPGRLEHRISKGSATYEFLSGNFKERSALDTVYATANPNYIETMLRLMLIFMRLLTSGMSKAGTKSMVQSSRKPLPNRH